MDRSREAELGIVTGIPEDTPVNRNCDLVEVIWHHQVPPYAIQQPPEMIRQPYIPRCTKDPRAVRVKTLRQMLEDCHNHVQTQPYRYRAVIACEGVTLDDHLVLGDLVTEWGDDKGDLSLTYFLVPVSSTGQAIDLMSVIRYHQRMNAMSEREAVADASGLPENTLDSTEATPPTRRRTRSGGPVYLTCYATNLNEDEMSRMLPRNDFEKYSSGNKVPCPKCRGTIYRSPDNCVNPRRSMHTDSLRNHDHVITDSMPRKRSRYH